MTDVLRRRCVICHELLEFRPPAADEPFGALGGPARQWLHPSTGGVYAGACHCDNADNPLGLELPPHRYSHNAAGVLICPTWRDDHAAVPVRSAE